MNADLLDACFIHLSAYTFDMRAASFKHSLLSVDMDVCMYVRIFEAKYVKNYKR